MTTRSSHLAALAAATLVAWAGPVAAQDAPATPAAPADPWAQKKAKAEAEKEAWEAEKAKHEARAAAAKARFGELAEWESEGKVEAGEGAGELEASLLSAEATEGAAKQLVERLCVLLGSTTDSACLTQPAATSGKKLVIVSEASPLTFEAYDAFAAEIDAIQKQLKDAINARPQRSAPPGGEISTSASLVGAATALSVVSSLFRTDYKVLGLSFTPDDMVLAKAVALAAKQRNLRSPILVPALYSAPAVTEANPAVIQLRATDRLREQAAARLPEIEAAARQLQAQAAVRGLPAARKAQLEAMAAAYTPVKAQVEAAIKRYDDFRDRITTPDDKGVVALGVIAQEAQVAGALADGGFLLVLKANVAGGTAYTERNFWTFLGEMPFSVSGGALNSYSLFDGQTGELLDAGLLKQTGPFMKIHQANRRFQPKPPPRRP